jgi:hypothetical protein
MVPGACSLRHRRNQTAMLDLFQEVFLLVIDTQIGDACHG